MNDETHDDSAYVLDRAITFYRGWSIERETSRLWVWYHPDDEEVVSFAPSLEAARMAIDAVIAAEEEERFEPAKENDMTQENEIEVFFEDGDGDEGPEEGWYWWSREFGGDCPDSPPYGPFDSEDEARQDATPNAAEECEHARALPEEYDEQGRTPTYPCTVRCPDCGELIHVGRRS